MEEYMQKEIKVFDAPFQSISPSLLFQTKNESAAVAVWNRSPSLFEDRGSSMIKIDTLVC
jgi:hypothetical protein